MTSAAVTTTGPLCAQWTREHEVDPVGSIGSYRALLLIEWPLPWPRDIAEVPELRTLADRLAQVRGRLQAVVPGQGHGDTRRAVLYHADPGPFAAYRRLEAAGAPGEIVSLAAQLVGGALPPTTQEACGRELLVCTHGARDRCCGSLGTKLALSMADELAQDAAIEVRRTSHTGGHRFAPTAILLPEGTGWGYLDEDTLRTIVHRSGPVADVLGHYRGCAGLSSPRLQALERAVLAEVGWDLLDCPRHGSEESDGTVRLTVERHEDEQVWSARVRTGRVLPVPGCGMPVTPDGKTAEEFVVGALRRVR
jgi:hypothetical protein